MTMMDENELRRRFGELRDADRESAPDFAGTYDRARTDPTSRLQESPHHDIRSARRPRFRVRPLAIAAAAAVLVVAVWTGRARFFSPSGATSAIATWRAPTDVLLDTPGSELLGAMPALGESILDKMIPTYSLRGG
jgi:ferric-dicitrate binding protein FerR (iron transport regulator)